MSETEIIEGYQIVPEEDRIKAKVFFDRGKTTAGSGNFEYAIEMFLQGLQRDPDAIEAQKELYEIALRRKAGGGRGIGFVEALKLKHGGKDERLNLISAWKLLSYDPGNTDHMALVGDLALKTGFYDTVLYIGPIFLQGNATSAKPDFNKFMKLRDWYKSLKRWFLASEACQYALRVRPNDMDLPNEVKNLAAQETMQKAGYEKKGSFRDQIRDRDGQLRLLNADKEVNDADILARQIADARKQYDAEPNELGKLTKLVDLLLRTERPEDEERAIQLLQTAFGQTRQFRFQKAVGQIQMRQLEGEEKNRGKAYEADPQNAEARTEYETYLKERVEFELATYQSWAENYPTDMTHRFEVGKRQYQLGRYDEAVSSFQMARNDPKFRVEASILLGRTFLANSFLDEADETFAVLIRDYPQREGDRFKQMYYWRGRVLEQKGDVPEAIRHYSTVYQIDSGYLDAAARIKKLRGQGPKV